MGNSNNGDLDSYYMHIQIIGKNMQNFLLMISGSAKSIKAKESNRKNIEDYWDFDYFPEKTVDEQINDYFKLLQNNRDSDDQTKNIRESLIVKIKNPSDPLVNKILEKMNKLRESHYMPLVLLLSEEIIQNHTITTSKFKKIDPRTIFLENYSENFHSYSNEYNKIKITIRRFCSIHNELGDRFTIGEKNNSQDYDLIENYFPFNLNIACIGRIGQGKSTGVNSILKSYKAKESKKGGAQTKNLTFYQVNNQPVRILDIPGFEDEKTVKDAIEKFKKCGEEINKIKDNLHIILYFFNYKNERSFENLELPMIEEIIKHKSSKIIYVVTHFDYKKEDEDDDDEEINLKEDFIKKINSGIQLISEKSKNNITIKQFMYASLNNNTIFVNFHGENFKEVGTEQLFKKIGEFFKSTEDYLSSQKSLSEYQIKLRAEELRKRANDVLLSNKIYGSVIGILPGIDWLIQKFVIKKNAAKKAGQIFGIDVKFLDEENEGKKSKIESSKILTGEMNSCIEIEMKMDGEQLTEEDTKEKVTNSIKTTGETGIYIGGGLSIGSAFSRAATTTSEVSTGIISSLGTTTLKVVGTGCFVVGAISGIIVGGVMTNSYCNELLDKFENYYKENANKIANSYIQALNYFNRNYN